MQFVRFYTNTPQMIVQLHIFNVTLRKRNVNMSMKNIIPEIFHIDWKNIQEFERMRSGNNGFLLCKNGEMTLQMDGNMYGIHSGNLYIYPAFSETMILNISKDFVGIAGVTDFNSVMSSIHSTSDSLSYIHMRFHPLVSLEAGQIGRIEEVVSCIEHRANVQMELREQVVYAFSQALCYEIMGVYMEKMSVPQGRQNRKDKMLQQFISDLSKHFKTHRDVAFYAELQYITPRHFATQIHAKSGRTPLQWVALFTIIEAKRLLDNPKMSIKEIAEKLHFPEQASFGRYFKKYTGISPTEYRQH